MKILIIDDEPAVREAYASKLRSTGYDVVTASDGKAGLSLFEREQPALIVLDMVMPEMDGLAVVRRVRSVSQTPILIFTAQATKEDEVIQGLEAGADEYLVKPVRLNEFVARVQALLRRAQLTTPTADVLYEDDRLSINLQTREVFVQGARQHLTPTEFKLLAVLLENAGRVVEQRELLEKVWGPEYVDDIYYPRVYVSQLRSRKIEQDPAEPTYIITEHRVGYRFEKAASGSA